MEKKIMSSNMATFNRLITSELDGTNLDWVVARALDVPMWSGFRPSTDGKDGDPIIERELISGCWDGTHWLSEMYSEYKDLGMLVWRNPMKGPTRLIAAMRCFVRYKFGDEIPESAGY